MPTYIDQLDVTGGVPIRGLAGSQKVITDTVTRTVEGQYGQGGIDGNFNYVRTILTSTTVKSGAGFLNAINVNNRIGQRIFIYDSTSKVNVRATASQCLNTVTVLDFPANNTINPRNYPLNVKFTKGLIVIVKPITVTSVTDVTFSFR